MTTFDPRTVHSMPAQQFGTPRTGGFPGQQFPGPVPPPPPSKPSRAKRPLASKIIAGVIAAGVVVGGAGTWIALAGSSTAVAEQSTSFAGADPTTNPFGTDAPQVATVAATGPQSGGTPAMYAATTPPACDTADFLAQLQADPAKLAAFGGVFRVGPGDVPAFVNSLSPVVLRAATAVTDHPYQDGAFVEEPAVLAPGTAVLVNSYGEPTVKCFNGNPLTAGLGAPDAVTVTPAPQALTQFRFTTIDNSRPIIVTAPPPVAPPNPTLVAHYNYDGTVLLSDGRLVDQHGHVIAPKGTIPAGAFKNPDGSFTVNGKVFNPDGTERKDIVVGPQVITLPVGGTTTVPGFTIRTDGVAVDAKGNPITPQPKVIRNYDGTATIISGNHVEVWGTDGGNISKFDAVPPQKVNPDGSITNPDGSIVNPDGSTARTPVTLPNGTTEKPNGGETPKSLLNPDGSLPAGATKQTDGTIVLKDGTVLNPDGTVKTPGPKNGKKDEVLAPGTIKVQNSCTGIVTDTAGPATCQLPTGSADSATGTTPAATGTGTTKDGDKSSTGSGTSKSTSSSSSSSSSSGSQSTAKEGTAKEGTGK